MNDMPLRDPYADMIDLLDRSLMSLYRHTQKNARRIAHLTMALLPLMALLVGSCKTSQLPWAYGSNAGPEQFRTALFPDQVNFTGARYYPAAGYISGARSFVAEAPQALLMLTPREIGYIFGKPTLLRQDADAEVWQYKTKKCVANFYFYGKSNLAYIDVHAKEEMTPGSKFSAAPAPLSAQSRCLKQVMAADFESTRA